MVKKAKADAQQEIEKQLEKEAEYREAKEKFFGLMFSDGLINIRVLESVAEIVLEGKMLHHCVGGYHSKADSLILSACIDGQRIEYKHIARMRAASRCRCRIMGSFFYGMKRKATFVLHTDVV